MSNATLEDDRLCYRRVFGVSVRTNISGNSKEKMALRFKSRQVDKLRDFEKVSPVSSLVGAEYNSNACLILKQPSTYWWMQPLFQKTGICWYQSTLELLTLLWLIPVVFDNVPSFLFACGVIGVASICLIPKLPYCTFWKTLVLICLRAFLSCVSFVLLSLVRGKVFETKYLLVLIPYFVSCVIVFIEAIGFGERIGFTPYDTFLAGTFAFFNMASGILFGSFMDSPPKPFSLWFVAAGLFSVPRLIAAVSYTIKLSKNCHDPKFTCYEGFERIVCILTMILDIVSVFLLVVGYGGLLSVYSIDSVLARSFVLCSIFTKVSGWFLTFGVSLLMLCYVDERSSPKI